MIDPLGPDPSDPALPARKVNEITPEFEVPDASPPPRPKVRYANYDSPEALAKPDAAPAPTLLPKPTATARPVPAPQPASTALARQMPPKPGKLERAIGVARTFLPLVGKMLPLLEGNVVGAAANLLGNRPIQEVNLQPLEEAISRLQTDQRALTFHTTEQKRAIRQLEDEFAAVQEAVQKNAADQAELAEHVVKLARRMSGFMRLVTILLIVSILFTTLLVVRIAYILRP